MLGTAVAQLRVVASVAFGLPFAHWALDRLVSAAAATHHEFGCIGGDSAHLLSSTGMDAGPSRELQVRRFRALAQRAARETDFYQPRLAELKGELNRLSYGDIARIPPTSRAALRSDPDGFVCHGADPVLVASSSGTSGQPVRVAFSTRELSTFTALTALGFLLAGDLLPRDVVCLAVGGQGIGALILQRACLRIGALCVPGADLPSSALLARLATPCRLAGKNHRVNVLYAHPSTLGELVEAAPRLGYRPCDFGIDRIVTGGEALTAGLRARLRTLFGGARVIETYGTTETFGANGLVCTSGHVHFHPVHALVEVLDCETHAAVEPGGVGTLVVTPLPPFRESTVLLRYDTEDLVRKLPATPTCELRALPAVSHVLGRRAQAIRHARGWTYPRVVLEALEAVDDVPLPARFGVWAVDDGVDVEVLVRADTPDVRCRVSRALAESNVPLQALRLVIAHDSRTELAA